jgi:hypothetical protein
MADPKVEKIEKKLDETGAPNQDSELSDSDVEKVSGGIHDGFDCSPNSSTNSKTICNCP